MEGYRHLIKEVNELNYKNIISRVVPSRRKVIDALKRLNNYRSTNRLNTALFTLNYKNILKGQQKRYSNNSKMKTLKTPDAFVQSNVREDLQSLEKSVDAAIKRKCSLCGPIRTPSSSQATTHGTDLPINFSSAKRWVVLPSGRTDINNEGRRSSSRRLIVEQTGRYEGPRFVPNSAGRHLHWASNNNTLVSKNCCLLDYLNKRALKESSIAKHLKQSKCIESISLKLAAQNVRDNEIVTRIDQEDIKVAILL
uniref:Wsv267-like protein n=1 Tax=Hemigrapsus takanoi nimavirus TaxID=2133792 RepID=A0A401INZ8_9VIRU|nr:MAG: wsv267-like protein [Hemigrapsus takanoi nimavirus]GBG35343.1 wsv267-like protein [Hemigrapsus takanoi nimavirus]